jgi:hypothetical protein
MAARRRRRRNPQYVTVRKVENVKRRVVSGGGMFGTTEGKVMLVGGVVLVGVVGYFLLSGSGG